MLRIAVVLGASLTAGCGSGSSQLVHPIPKADLKAATLRVLADFNSKRPAAVCADASPQTVAWATTFLRSLSGTHRGHLCPAFVAQYFGPAEDGEGNLIAPAFARVSVARWVQVGMRGPYGRVAAQIRVSYAKPVSSTLQEPHLIVFFFERLNGRLVLAAMPPVGVAIEGSTPAPVLNIAPADRTASQQPAQIPVPAFHCDGPVQAAADPANDVHFGESADDQRLVPAPWLDIRRVAVHGANGSHPCIEIDFAAPIRPDTDIRMGIGIDEMFGANGDVAGFGFTPREGTYGERGSALYLALPYRLPGPFRQMSLCAVQDRAFDPLDFGEREGSDGWAAGGFGGTDPNHACGAY